MKRYLFALTAAALLIAGCGDNPLSPFGDTDEAGLHNDLHTYQGVTAQLKDGNPGDPEDFCSAIDENYLAAKMNVGSGEGEFLFPYTTDSGIQLTSADGKRLRWDAPSNIFVHLVTVKGGPNYHQYDYDEQFSFDYWLRSPDHPRAGQVPNISNIVACYTMVENCWKGETAWSDGAEYSGSGWAMYTAFEDGKVVDLIAGQSHTIGTVTFEDNGDGTVDITVAMNASGRFADELENLKIQGYDEAPSGNPAPGQFDGKFTVSQAQTSYTATVPLANFYGVHVDAERAIACPTGE